MIQILGRTLVLTTASTSYVMHADEAGNLRHLYYGERLDVTEETVRALLPKIYNQNGCSIVADPTLPQVCLDDVCLEISSRGKGDHRDPFAEIVYPDGSRTSDFRFDNAVILDKKPGPEGLPSANVTADQESLLVTLRDRNGELRMELVYTPYEDCDCITRFTRLYNEGEEPVQIERLMSLQLDLEEAQLKITSFHGEWAREMNRFDTMLQAGKFVNASHTGFSSNQANPFVLYARPETGEEYGRCYATNLLYSGMHLESAEIGGYGKSRILTGICPDDFSWQLMGGGSFESPEAVMTCSMEGYGGISKNMHAFVREYIVRGFWQKKERPVLVNSWEAMYFDVKEAKILKLAKAAKEAGAELFVLDDGWFGKRDNDACSLGDWQDHTEKLPGGLARVSAKIHEMGLLFGIWVEPEMVSEDSDLYRAHPEWAVKIPGKDHAVGRNQMILDLSSEEVQGFLVETLSDVFTRSKADYVKWDMNRHMSDLYSQGLLASSQGEFAHRYMLGLYHVLMELTERFPQILFEGCASGGNRFDLGMLCYMPQIWASDNTDALSRSKIQNSYSYGYPQSVLGNHVSGCPNHQTLRTTPLETRFAIASAGVLGYELNLCELKKEELLQIKEQILLYKRWRKTLQYGNFYRLLPEYPSYYEKEAARFMIVAEGKEEAVCVTMQSQNLANFSHYQFKAKGLDLEREYTFTNLHQQLKYDVRRMGSLINTAAPIHIRQDSPVHHLVSKFYKLDGEVEEYRLSGRALCRAGVHLAPTFGGTGMNAGTGLYQDYDAKMYFINEV